MTSQAICTRDRGGCFAAGTLVRTPRGMFPIEALAAGDEVITHDHRIARIHTAHAAAAEELVRIAFSDRTALVATPWHRFFELRGGLTRAEHLAPGTLVRNYDHSVAHVVRVERIAHGIASVYNLSLERDVGFYANGKLVEAPHANRILDTRSLLTRAS